MSKIEKIKEIAKGVFSENTKTERRFAVTINGDGTWHKKSAWLSDDAWSSFIFNLENDPTVSYYEEVGENVVLIVRKAKKDPESE